MTHAELNQLIAALRHDQWSALNDDQIAVLLSWLAHSRRNPGVRQLEDKIGPAGCDQNVFDAALSTLDVLLFDAESLHARQAGVGPELSRDARRRRYRLLMSAFHPDRYPGRAEWLTARSQIITRAYARFKSQPDEAPGEFGITVAATPTVPNRGFRRPPAYTGISPEGPKSESLHERLARDRFLAHKVVGGLSLLVILPVISILLDSPGRPALDDYPVADTRSLTDTAAPSPFLDWPPPEPETVDWTLPDQPSGAPINATFAARAGLDWPEPPPTESPAWLRSANLSARERPLDALGRAAVAEDSTPADTLEQDLVATPIRLVEETAARIADVMAHMPEADNTRVINALPTMPANEPEDASREMIEPRVAERPEQAPTEGQIATSPDESSAEPAVVERSGESPADAVVATAASAPDTVTPENTAETAQSVQPAQSLESHLALGPLANHPAGRLLDSYHQSIEQGDLASLLDMLAPSALLGGQQDRLEFEQSYRELFASSRRRALTLRVIHARRQDSGWLVRTDYQLEMIRADSGAVERVRREVEYSMTEDDGRLRIAAISY
jgi:hypothetical protein